MPIIVGFLGLGTAIANHRLVEVKDYTRPPVAFNGHPNHDQTPRVFGIEEPVNDFIRFGAVLDAATGGRVLVHWPWIPPHFEIRGDGLAYPFVDIMVSLEYKLNMAVNAARQGLPVTISIDPGSIAGSINGQPMAAGVRLTVE